MGKLNKTLIVCVGGTRPEAIKLAPLFCHGNYSARQKLLYLHTGQHQDLVNDVFDWFSIKPTRLSPKIHTKSSLPEKISLLIATISKKLIELKPNLVCIQGDTISTLAGALSAFYLKIPVAHIEAGLRTGDKLDPWPEESTRCQVSQLASLHFAPTRIALNNLVREGISRPSIHLVGNTIADALDWSLRKLRRTKPPWRPKEDFFLVTAHRRELSPTRLKELCQILISICEHFKIDAHLPMHPRPDVKEVLEKELGRYPNIHLLPALKYPQFLQRLEKSAFVFTDSGGVQEEAACLKKTLVIFRKSTERPEVLSSRTHLYRSKRALTDFLSRQLNSHVKTVKLSSSGVNSKILGDGKAAQKILRTLAKLRQQK